MSAAALAASGVARRLPFSLKRLLTVPCRWYHRKLSEFPLTTKSCTSGAILGFADFLSQKIKHGSHGVSSGSTSSVGTSGDNGKSNGVSAPPGNEKRSLEQKTSGNNGAFVWNARQSLWMAAYGAFFVAPFCHAWYQSERLKVLLKRVAFDQAVMGPVFTTGLFVSRGLVAGQDARTIGRKMRADFPKVLGVGALVWPPAQLINFLFVPLPYRVLFNNCVGLGWSTFTSVVATYNYNHNHNHRQPQQAFLEHLRQPRQHLLPGNRTGAPYINAMPVSGLQQAQPSQFAGRAET